MAESTTQFAIKVPVANEDQSDFLTSKLSGMDESEEGKSCLFDELGGEILIYNLGEVSGAIDPIVELLLEFQTKFKVDGPFRLQWAETCSKPWEGHFGGGVVVMYKGKEKSMNLGEEANWIEQSCEDWVDEV